MKRAALILAGGKARRFQQKQVEWQDKALALLFGKPLIIHAVENARSVVDEILVSVNDIHRKTIYAEVFKSYGIDNIELIVDEKISYVSGPNVAIMTGLKSLKADFVVTLPCDMPLIKPEVIQYMFEAAENVEVAVPMWPKGRLETLFMILERKSGIKITETLCQLGRPRSDDIMRGASKILFVSPLGKIKSLDQELRSFVNINHHEDLLKLRTRAAQGDIVNDFSVALAPLITSKLKLLRTSAFLYHENKFDQASEVFSACAAEFENQKSHFWGGISREKEGETLLAWSKLQKEPANSADLDYRSKDAFLAASANYRLEAKMHSENRCRFLAELAWGDILWCESMVMGKASCGKRYPPKKS